MFLLYDCHENSPSFTCALSPLGTDWRRQEYREKEEATRRKSWSVIGPPCTEGDLEKKFNIGLTVEKIKPLLFGGITHFGFVCNAISLP